MHATSSQRTTRIVAISAAALAAVSVAAANAQTATKSRSLGGDASAACTALGKVTIASSEFGVPSGAASIDSATLVAGSALAIAEKGPTPAARITPETPHHCRLIGRIAPIDTKAPPIRFQVNLPLNWNGRSVQYGGGGFNGTLITATGLPPAARFDKPSPLAQGYVTYGTDSGHETKQGEPPQAFAMNDEALVNFAHASYKKVRDAAVAIMNRAYGSPPEKLYFLGSSEGGREGLTMAQRYPADFHGIFSRVPVINWTGLQMAGTRNGIATMGDAWLTPAHAKLVGDAVIAACDASDGTADNLVANPAACRKAFDVAKLQCKAGQAADTCLNDGQVRAVKALHSPYKVPFKLANGVNEYPGWGVSGENLAPFGPTGGWRAWWLGASAPKQPPEPTNSIAWVYGSGAMRYFYAKDPNYDVTKFKPEEHKKRILEVSAMMDSTNPDLSKFRARGGKLIILENMADYAQSPYAGINYVESVKDKMGAGTTNRFVRLYTAPGVDHVGSGAPANVDMLDVLADWVERGKAPGTLEVVEQKVETGFAVTRSLPLCQWPLWPKYNSGDTAKASSFTCSR